MGNIINKYNYISERKSEENKPLRVFVDGKIILKRILKEQCYRPNGAESLLTG
jgi:hypothetical protein